MVDKIYFPQPIVPVKKPAETNGSTAKVQPPTSFQQVLDQELNTSLKFSGHALARLNARQINLGTEDLKRLNAAVDKAAQKGAKDSLVLMDNLAFIVSVKNKTVVTAVDEASLKENVFTNIDSAVII